MQQLKNKLSLLVSLDNDYKNFGSESHRYQFNSCLTQSEVQAFEAKYNITLPEDYRNFLLEIGNGGAGPGYGLFKLEEALEEAINKPFPLKEAWNDLDLEGKTYISRSWSQGTITIATYGCGIDALLVITGEQREKIWIDDRCSDGGIYPCSLGFCDYFHGSEPEEFSSEDQALSFYVWYEDWLDRSLEMMSRI